MRPPVDDVRYNCYPGQQYVHRTGIITDRGALHRQTQIQSFLTMRLGVKRVGKSFSGDARMTSGPWECNKDEREERIQHPKARNRKDGRSAGCKKMLFRLICRGTQIMPIMEDGALGWWRGFDLAWVWLSQSWPGMFAIDHEPINTGIWSAAGPSRTTAASRVEGGSGELREDRGDGKGHGADFHPPLRCKPSVTPIDRAHHRQFEVDSTAGRRQDLQAATRPKSKREVGGHRGLGRRGDLRLTNPSHLPLARQC